MSSSKGRGEASDAAVQAGSERSDPAADRGYLGTLADEAEHAVQVIEGKLAGMHESLAAAKDRAKAARAAAHEGTGE